MITEKQKEAVKELCQYVADINTIPFGENLNMN